jgi:hypothetical protein
MRVSVNTKTMENTQIVRNFNFKMGQVVNHCRDLLRNTAKGIKGKYNYAEQVSTESRHALTLNFLSAKFVPEKHQWM